MDRNTVTSPMKHKGSELSHSILIVLLGTTTVLIIYSIVMIPESYDGPYIIRNF